jgi:hypothetical protein
MGEQTALLAGFTCGALALMSGGPVEALIGFGAGYVITHSLLVRGRFIRR